MKGEGKRRQPWRQKWWIPTCKYCGVEVDYCHICNSCKDKKKRERKNQKSMVK